MIPVAKPASRNDTNVDADGSSVEDQRVYANIMRAEVRTKVWLQLDGGFIIGEGGLDLLSGIAVHRSLRRAAQNIGWSYRHAWGYLRQAERALGGSLTRPVHGKGPARGTVLSHAGERLVERMVLLKNAALHAAVAA
jgi:molybdate transport system regulatory protein